MFSPLRDGENEPKKNRTSKEILPHYSGSIHFCSFPILETYCYQVLVAYKPWSKSNPLSNKHGKAYRDQSLEFTSSPICPQTILIAYERVKHRKLEEDKGIFKHAPTSNVDYNQDMEMEMEIEGLDGDDAEAINMMALHGSNVPNDTWSLPRGYDYDWSKPTFPRNPDLWKTAKTFLIEALDSSGTDVDEVDIPARKVDEEVVHYNIRDAMASQSSVLREWMEWEAGDQKSKCVPLRLTVRRATGTGKSFIINTIVSNMRRMFYDHDVVHVIAPTGMAASNVLGGTLHRFAGLDWRNMKKGMTNSTMKKLQKKLRNTVAIMMDERSMLSQIILGLVEQAVARSAHECGHLGEDWGGIPVMLLFGDDYQLPSIGYGVATSIPQLKNNSCTKGLHDMTHCQGGLQFMNLAEEVMELD
jgi:hypothetical protein